VILVSQPGDFRREVVVHELLHLKGREPWPAIPRSALDSARWPPLVT
jgi:hypothetical protein